MQSFSRQAAAIDATVSKHLTRTGEAERSAVTDKIDVQQTRRAEGERDCTVVLLVLRQQILNLLTNACSTNDKMASASGTIALWFQWNGQRKEISCEPQLDDVRIEVEVALRELDEEVDFFLSKDSINKSLIDPGAPLEVVTLTTANIAHLIRQVAAESDPCCCVTLHKDALFDALYPPDLVEKAVIPLSTQLTSEYR